MFKELFCGLIVCGGAVVGAMSVDNSGEEEAVAKKPPIYVSKYEKKAGDCWHVREGYEELQQKYPHVVKDYDSTRKAMENILADAQAKTFVATDMQAVMDYFHWWYDVVDPCDIYKEKVHYIDEYNVAHVTWFESYIQDLVAKILDELQDTGGTAYACLHW